MTSLAQWMRKSLLWGSSCPSAEELADEYIKELEFELLAQLDGEENEAEKMGKLSQSFIDHADGYRIAVHRIVKLMKGMET
jgi:hypothetical protein